MCRALPRPLALLLALACSGAEPAPAPGTAAPGPSARDRGVYAARGAPSGEVPWDAAWTLAVYARDPASVAPSALARSLGGAARPLTALQPPRPGQVAVVWVPAGADIRTIRAHSAGGALVFALAPGDRGWRDDAVVGLGHAGAGVLDTVASAGRWLPDPATPDAPTAAAAAAWELRETYGLSAAPIDGAEPIVGVALGASPPDDPPPDLRAWAARGALPVDQALADPDPAVRLGAVSRASSAQRAALIADPEPLVRARAADGLADIAALRAALDDGSSVVRLVAGDHLARLARAGDASEPLRAALRHAATLPDAYLRWKAAHGFGHLPGSVADLSPMLADPDVDVRREAARALGRQRDPAAVPALTAALADDNSFVRQWVARGLAALRHPDALPALRIAAADDSALVVEVAVQGARELGVSLPGRPYEAPRPGDVDALLALTRGPDGIARKDALKHLAGTPEGARAALDALDDPDSEVRKLAVETLGWEPSPQPALLRALPDPDPDVRVTTLIALRHRPVPGSADAVGALLADPDPEVRMRAAQALGALAAADPDGGARAWLDPVRADPDERTRAAAISAWPQRLDPAEPAVLVRRASAQGGGPPCDRLGEDLLASSACPSASPRAATAGRSLLLLEDDLLHLRASWSSPKDRPASHRVLRPPVLRDYGDPNRG